MVKSFHPDGCGLIVKEKGELKCQIPEICTLLEVKKINTKTPAPTILGAGVKA